MFNTKNVISALFVIGTAFAGQVYANGYSFENTDGSQVTFPNTDSAWLKGGAIMDPAHPRSMGFGLTKNQVRSIIQYPHFKEGVFGTNQWNYIFNFKKKDGTYLTCQYQVHFDKNARTQGMYWNTEECLKFVQNKPETKPEVVVQPQRAISMAADGMFAFGKSSLSDLLPAGRSKLERLADQINQAYDLKSVEIIGHTDRIGSYDRNMALSQARAETVKAFLANRGVNVAQVTARGVGSSQPVVTCSGATTAAVIACLQPNRRVEVNLNGTVKN